MSGLRFHCAATLLATALGLASAAGCARVPDAADSGADAFATAMSAAEIEAQLPLVDRIQAAPMHVRHGGTRRLQFYYETQGVEHVLAYQERVTADGAGRFALDPLVVETPAMSVQQREVFDLLQKQREGFFFRYRDFGVRQSALFLANYRIQVVGAEMLVAGRECTQLEVRRQRGGRSWYRAAVDVETGLVLMWIEYSPEGRLLARGEFTAFTLDPDLEGVEWFESPLHVETLAPGSESAALLGFTPHQPQVLPSGYQLLRSELVQESNVTWLRRVYGDGLENLFVLERGPAAVKAGSTGPAEASEAALAASNDAVHVRLCQVGAWTLAEAARGSEQLFVVGKVGEDAVVRCLQSAF